MKINTLLAKNVSYKSDSNGKAVTRKLTDIKYIVLHNTGNNGDSAINNAKYFHNSNTRTAGAHFFIDQKGVIYKSIKIIWTAWAVGGSKYSNCNKTGGGAYYGLCTNANSVSIEMCDIMKNEPSDKMKKSLKELIEYIQKKCPNAKTIIRHFDVTGKECPVRFISINKWDSFIKELR